MGPPVMFVSPRSMASTLDLVSDVPDGEEGVAAAVFGEAEGVVSGPGEPSGAAGEIGGDVGRVAAGGGDGPDVATSGALVGHEAADEGDALAIEGEAGNGELEAVHGGVGGVGVKDDLGLLAVGLDVELGDPPVVFAGRGWRRRR